MEDNMATKKEPSNNNQDQLTNLANRVSRSSIAVVDAVAQRGGFKGEEFSTIGALRDQCVQMIQIIESMEQEQAMTVDED
jgi:hypothetical protein